MSDAKSERDEWRAMATEAIDVALHWKERALAAERWARRWKAVAKHQRRGWRDAFASGQRTAARYRAYAAKLKERIRATE
jgi:hypothetical protein